MGLKQKLLLGILFVCLFTPIFIKNTYAAETDISDISMVYFLSDGGNGNVDTSFKITNPRKDGIVSQVELDVPYLACKVTKISIGSRKVSSSIAQGGNNCVIKIDFSENPLKPNQSETIKLSFTAVVGTRRDSSYFYLISNPFDNDVDFDISFANKSSKKFISILGANDEDNEYKTTQSRSFYVQTLTDYDLGIESNYTTQNSDSNSKIVLQSLPTESESQNVAYKEILNGLRGYIDESKNYYVAQEISADSETQTGFTAQISKSIEEGDFKESQFDFEFSLPDKYKKSEESGIESIHESIDTFLDSYKFQRGQLSLDNIWESESLSSFESSLLAAQIVDYYGGGYSLLYGYYIGGRSSELLPHVWLEVEIDGEIYTLDPFLSGQENSVYFSEVNTGDRLIFGHIASSDVGLNRVLSLLSYKNIEELPVLKIVDDLELVSSEVYSISIPSGTELYSGFYSTIDLTFESESSKLRKITNLKINDSIGLYKNIANSNQNLEVLVLPNGSSKIPIEFRSSNFFEKGAQEVEIVLSLEDVEEIFSKKQIVEFKVDVKTIWSLIWAFNFVLFSISYILFKILWKRG